MNNKSDRVPDPAWKLPNFITLAGILAMAGVVTIPVIYLTTRNAFNGLYGQDPYAYYKYATGPLRESLLAGGLPPPFFWPPGFPILVSVMSILLGLVPPTGQAVSLAAGALTPVFTFLLAREILESQDKFAGSPMLAGLICAFSGQLWQSSAVIMADTTGLCAATLGAFALLRYAKSPAARTPWLVLAAGGFAFAILTRWAYALPAIPATIYALAILARQSGKLALTQALAASVAALIVLSPLLPAVLGRWSSPGIDRSAFFGDLEVYRWDLETAFRTSHQTPDGLLKYRLPNGLYYALAPAHRYYFTPLLALFIVPGLWAAMRQWRTPAVVFILAWPSTILIFHSGAPWQNLRFTLAYLPPLAILATGGIRVVQNHLPPQFRLIYYAYLAAGLFLMAFGGWQVTQNLIDRSMRDVQTARWVEKIVPAGSQLFTFGLTLTIEHNTEIEVHDIFFQDPEGLENLLLKGQPTFVLLDTGNIESQWTGKTPWTNFHWLHTGPGLARVGDSGPYTLFEVSRYGP